MLASSNYVTLSSHKVTGFSYLPGPVEGTTEALIITNTILVIMVQYTPKPYSNYYGPYINFPRR